MFELSAARGRTQHLRQAACELLQAFQVVHRQHGVGRSVQLGGAARAGLIAPKAQQRIEPQQARTVALEPGQLLGQCAGFAGIETIAHQQHQRAPAYQTPGVLRAQLREAFRAIAHAQKLLAVYVPLGI